jgi:hypothetical protein
MRWVLAASLLAVGCGSNGTGDVTGEVGSYQPGPAFAGADGGPATLDAQVEQNGVGVQVVVVQCSGGCADIEAVATGGNPPYTFAWSDGPTTAARHVCPAANASYQVQVTDTASTGELPHSAQTAVARATANVLQCPDASTSGSALCITNGSFEGTPETIEAFDTIPVFEAPPWDSCETNNSTYSDSTPDIVGPQTLPNYGSGALPAPTDGSTYAHLGYQAPLHEYVSQKLCSPMAAGGAYSFTVDMASRAGTLPAQIQVYGSTSDCSRQELLWTSPVLPTQWTRYCVTLRPTADAAYITLDPNGASTSPADVAFALVDNLTPVDRCL